MTTYTIEFTKLGAMKNWKKTVEANSFKEATDVAEKSFLRGKTPLRIWTGDDAGSTITPGVAEEMLFEMDANNADEIELKEGFGGRTKFSRNEVQSALKESGVVKKYRYNVAKRGDADG